MAAEPRYMLHKNDLPADVAFGDVLAVDAEFMGLNVHRDRLCTIQVYDGAPGGKVHIVQFAKDAYAAPSLKKLLSDDKKQKLFFCARSDMRWIAHYLGVMPGSAVCLRIASRMARSFTQDHNLENVVKNLIGIRMSKEQQSADWGVETLTEAQLDYACNDVIHLHALKEKLEAVLVREKRLETAQGIFAALPAIVRADLAGWMDEDLFGYEIPRPA